MKKLAIICLMLATMLFGSSQADQKSAMEKIRAQFVSGTQLNELKKQYPDIEWVTILKTDIQAAIKTYELTLLSKTILI